MLLFRLMYCRGFLPNTTWEWLLTETPGTRLKLVLRYVHPFSCIFLFEFLPLTYCSSWQHIKTTFVMPLPLTGGGIKRWCCLTSVCLTSATYIRPKSRTHRPRKTKIGTEVANVTRDSDTTFKVKRSKVKVTRPLYSPWRLHVRQLQRWAWESIHHGNLVLRCCLEGRGHIVAATHLQLVMIVL